MQFVIQLCAYLIGIPLQILTISVLMRGGFKRFPLVFLYTVASFVASIAEMPLMFNFLYNDRKTSRGLALLYYTNDAVLQALLFAVVISLIYEVTSRVGPRRVVRLSLVCGAFITAATSLLIHYHPDPVSGKIGPWMAPWSRDLKLCATILVLALWTFLVSSKNKDRLLLMVAGAMGILFTGEAIGESLQLLATPGRIFWLSRLGSLIVAVSNIAFLYLWWVSFRHESPARPKPRTA